MEKLTGSKKQIQWAEEIRKNFISSVADAAEEECREELEKSGEPEKLDYAFFQKIVEKILAQTSAKWWIGNMKDVELYDINLLAEDPDEDTWKEFLDAYNIREA